MSAANDEVKVETNFTLEQSMKVQSRNRDIAVLFL